MQAAHLIISLPHNWSSQRLHHSKKNSLWGTLKFACFGSPRALHVTAALRVTGRLHVTAPLHVTGSPAVVHWRATPQHLSRPMQHVRHPEKTRDASDCMGLALH